MLTAIFEVYDAQMNGNEVKTLVPLAQALADAYMHIEEVARDPKGAAGTPTGYGKLDNALVGMGAGNLIVIGARPGMGKTSFAMNIATNVAKMTNKAICGFSLEMSCEELVERIIASEALIDSKKLRAGKLTTEEWAEISEKASELAEMNILIDDTPGLTVTAMKAKLRKVKNVGLVVIDYLQQMQSDRRFDNRALEVGEISRGLKMLAKDMNIPVVCCAQLNRENATKDKIPQLTDLRESGSIEMDADVVMFLHRKDYYESTNSPQSETDLIIAKNRHGETRTVKFKFMSQFTKFVEIDDTHEE